MRKRNIGLYIIYSINKLNDIYKKHLDNNSHKDLIEFTELSKSIWNIFKRKLDKKEIKEIENLNKIGIYETYNDIINFVGEIEKNKRDNEIIKFMYNVDNYLEKCLEEVNINNDNLKKCFDEKTKQINIETDNFFKILDIYFDDLIYIDSNIKEDIKKFKKQFRDLFFKLWF